MSTYFELERRLTHLRKHRVRPSEKSRGANGGAPAQRALNGNGKARAASRAVRSFTTPVSYRVSGTVPPLRQPTSMTCWATVTTMMQSWRQNTPLTIESALAAIGSQYLAKFQANQGLSSSEKGPFLAAAGLMGEPPMCYTIEGWLQLLRSYGPLWVTTDEDPSAGFAIHARIMVGVEGDGTTDGTSFRIVDPGTGSEYTESFANFTRKFEEEAAVLPSNAPLRLQVVHWPANSQSGSQSHGRIRVSSMSRRASGSWRASASAFEDAGAPDAEPAQLAWGARVSSGFRARVRSIAEKLRCDPNHLMAVMAFETGERFSPSVRNPRSGATGLIQFMPRTARTLGTTTDALAGLTAEQQLDYVERYLRPYAGRLATIEDLYMAVLLPSAIGDALDAVLMAEDSDDPRSRRRYEQNRALDANRDRRITKEEAAAPVRRRLTQGLQPANAG